VPFILLEYGDKMSPAIWDGMKRLFSDAAAAPTPQQMEGSSLYSLQTWASGIGYDTYLVGATGKRAVLVPVTGRLWRDEYEVCRDKKQKFSANGRIWTNFSAWNPQWSAVCWYDVALVLRKPRVAELRRNLLEATSLPPHFCDSVRANYPQWIDRPQPSDADLCCTHKVGDPRQGHVCHSFIECARKRSGGDRSPGGGSSARLGKLFGFKPVQVRRAKGVGST